MENNTLWKPLNFLTVKNMIIKYSKLTDLIKKKLGKLYYYIQAESKFLMSFLDSVLSGASKIWRKWLRLEKSTSLKVKKRVELLSSTENSTMRDSDTKGKKEMNTASNKKISEKKENQVKSKEGNIAGKREDKKKNKWKKNLKKN